eukprot:TRINITY_DN11174_c0_g1_i1.p1 TRINITY_DN11174_c0_g1~~TRINITY_DN11174_c0_g1_i1.p1  ORF type:complete len:400 (-),score=101.09 TRINITY_DN11174_c0_g1_i1:66-1169(-)
MPKKTRADSTKKSSTPTPHTFEFMAKPSTTPVQSLFKPHKFFESYQPNGGLSLEFKSERQLFMEAEMDSLSRKTRIATHSPQSNPQESQRLVHFASSHSPAQYRSSPDANKNDVDSQKWVNLGVTDFKITNYCAKKAKEDLLGNGSLIKGHLNPASGYLLQLSEIMSKKPTFHTAPKAANGLSVVEAAALGAASPPRTTPTTEGAHQPEVTKYAATTCSTPLSVDVQLAQTHESQVYVSTPPRSEVESRSSPVENSLLTLSEASTFCQGPPKKRKRATSPLCPEQPHKKAFDFAKSVSSLPHTALAQPKPLQAQPPYYPRQFVMPSQPYFHPQVFSQSPHSYPQHAHFPVDIENLRLPPLQLQDGTE